ncbi:sporulation protein YjcZ [Cohnella sp. AR92]|nr:sporulation protein YjcZ [Cohnella sp. AR92]RUS46004.1 sporulation protein YjcZ [Cohnella sp. AR92]
MSQPNGAVYGYGASTTIVIVLFILLVIVMKIP